jgi:predicted transcriptional regulator of viral defense system
MSTGKKFLDLFRSKNTVFTFKDIALILKESDGENLRKRINYYVKKGDLYKIRKGIYAKDKDYEKFELATKIYTPSYVSFETVLLKEGVIFQYYKDIFAVSYLSRKIDCDGQTYVFRKIKNETLNNSLGIGQENNYYIASKERAFMDMLYIFKNYYFDNLRSVNWDFCFELLPIYKNKSLGKKLNSYYKNYKKNA